jgi:hypothetical protein
MESALNYNKIDFEFFDSSHSSFKGNNEYSKKIIK